MFDAALRKCIDPPLDRISGALGKGGPSANTVTLSGFVVGLCIVPALAMQQYGAALVILALNRFADGLDGAIARREGPSDLGGYLDIVCDFIFYAAVPLGFALADPLRNALPAAVLIASFMGTGSSFLAYAIVAEKRGLSTNIRGRKSFFYLGGLTEGAETIAFFVAMCLFPHHFHIFAWCFAGLCAITAVTRIAVAYSTFR